MENIDKLLEAFLQLVKNSNSGAQVEFKVNHNQNEITITNASSGFLRDLYKNGRFIAHLTKSGLNVQMIT
jgi:hypothetical protein